MRAWRVASSMPSSSRTCSTSVFWTSASGWLMSRTWTMRSASSTSSSVARKAATSSVGRSVMKPTVSERMALAARGQRDAAAWSGRGWRTAGRGHHGGAGEPVEQGGLAGVGVADQRDDRERARAARLAVQAAGAADVLQLLLDAGDALGDQAAVELELALAGAAQEAEAAALALEVGPGAHQPASAGRSAAASSTWSTPSRVRARSPKISRIRPVRSMTLAFQRFSRLRCCTGRERGVDDDQLGRLGLERRGRSRRPCPSPAGSPGARWRSVHHSAWTTSRSIARGEARRPRRGGLGRRAAAASTLRQDRGDDPGPAARGLVLAGRGGSALLLLGAFCGRGS